MPAHDVDDMTLSLVGRRVALLRKFGNDAFTDELVQQELTLNANHGLTRPQLQLKRIMFWFVLGATAGRLLRSLLLGMSSIASGSYLIGRDLSLTK